MPTPGLKDLCFALLADAAGGFLDRQWSDGRFSSRPEYATEDWNFFDQQFLLPAALLYTEARADNPWRGAAGLWEAILRNGRHLDGRIEADGGMHWVLNGVVLPHAFVCQRLTCAWLQAYQLLKTQLPAEEEARWRSAIVRACGWLYEHKVVPFRHVTRFTAHQVETGTNHFALYLSLLWRAGQEFGRPEWVEACTDLMHGLIADQRPGGYWEEHEGPALGYDYLTFHAVDEYTTWSGDPAGREALRRGLDLHQHWTYPDGIAIECIDGRMRHLSAPMIWGLAGFTHWPDGRGYARLLLERLRAQGTVTAGETAGRLASAYLLLDEGEEELPPPLRPRYRAVLEGHSVVRKEGPWVVALSGLCPPTWPDNQFCLDSQARLSVWREGTGLVIDGSNSKFQPALSTFSVACQEEECYLPQSADLLSHGEEEEVIASRYGTFTGMVRARVRDATTLEISLEATGSDEVTGAFVPHVSWGETITIGGVGEVTLGDRGLTLGPCRHEGWLAFRGVTIRLPEGATLTYPVSPFNSYSADNTSGPHANRLLVSFPLGPAPARLQIEG